MKTLYCLIILLLIISSCDLFREPKVVNLTMETITGEKDSVAVWGSLGDEEGLSISVEPLNAELAEIRENGDRDSLYFVYKSKIGYSGNDYVEIEKYERNVKTLGQTIHTIIKVEIKIK